MRPSTLKSEAYTKQVSRLSGEFRDRHMVKLLTEAMKKGARVFAVVGLGHVVMQERALKATLSGAVNPQVGADVVPTDGCSSRR